MDLLPKYRPANFTKIAKTILHPTEEEESVHYFFCTVTNFARVERILESGEQHEHTSCASLCFNAGQHTLKFVTLPTPMHDAAGTWLSKWAYALPEIQLSTFVELNCTLEGFHGLFCGSLMVPDGAFYPSLDRKWPTIALEVGYTESYEDLVQNALLLLKGSKGKIGLVILVKLQPLEEGETAFESGFVEVWGYDCDSRKCIKFGKQTLYPRPYYFIRQKITLSWSNILREQERNLNPTKAPPSLFLDGLRMYIDGAVRRYLSRKRHREDTSGAAFD